MKHTNPPRIVIEDLPAETPLSEMEMAETYGAGRVRPSFELLETRELMASGITASLSGGVLRIEGTEIADKIYVLQSDGASQNVWVGSTKGGAEYGSFAGKGSGRVERIEVFGLGGDDVIDLQGTGTAHHVKVNSMIDAGAGNDTVLGGDAADSIFGGVGNDTIYGKAGNDLLFGEGGINQVFGDGGTNQVSAYGSRVNVRGKSLFLGNDSYLYSLTPATGAVKFHSSALQSFAVSGDQIFMLETGGKLIKQGAAATSGTELTCQSAADKLFFKDSDGYLYRFDSAAGSVSRFSAAQVKSFDVTSDGYVFLLQSNGYLYKQHANASANYATRFNSSRVDSFSIWAGEIYMLETKTDTNPGYLVKQGSNASNWSYLEYQESNGVLYFQQGIRLYSFVRTTGEMHRPNQDTQSFAVSGDYLACLHTNGVLTVTNVRTGAVTVSQGQDAQTGKVTSFAISGGKVFMEFADHYVRQQNLNGTDWQYAFVRNGGRIQVKNWAVQDGHLYGLAKDGTLFERDVQETAAKAFIRGVAVSNFGFDEKGDLQAVFFEDGQVTGYVTIGSYRIDGVVLQKYLSLDSASKKTLGVPIAAQYQTESNTSICYFEGGIIYAPAAGEALVFIGADRVVSGNTTFDLTDRSQSLGLLEKNGFADAAKTIVDTFIQVHTTSGDPSGPTSPESNAHKGLIQILVAIANYLPNGYEEAKRTFEGSENGGPSHAHFCTVDFAGYAGPAVLTTEVWASYAAPGAATLESLEIAGSYLLAELASFATWFCSTYEPARMVEVGNLDGSLNFYEALRAITGGYDVQVKPVQILYADGIHTGFGFVVNPSNSAGSGPTGQIAISTDPGAAQLPPPSQGPGITVTPPVTPPTNTIAIDVP